MTDLKKTEFHVAADNFQKLGSLVFSALAPEVLKLADEEDTLHNHVESVALGILGLSSGLAMELRAMGDEVYNFRLLHRKPLATKMENPSAEKKTTLSPIDGGEHE